MRTIQSDTSTLRLNSAIVPILRIGADQKTASLAGSGFLVGTPPHLVTAKHVFLRQSPLTEGELFGISFVNPDESVTSHGIAGYTMSKNFDVAVCPMAGIVDATSLHLVRGKIESNQNILCYEFSDTRISSQPDGKTSVHFSPFTHKGNILRRYINDLMVDVPTPSFDMSFPALGGASGAPVLRASDFAVAGMMVANTGRHLMPAQVLKAHIDGEDYEEVSYYLPIGQAMQSQVVIEFLESLQIDIDVID